MSKIIANLKKFASRKWIIISIAAVVLFVGGILLRGNSNTTVSVITPTTGDLSSTIRGTGQVTSKTDLNLSFNQSGLVKSIRVQVGDKARAGDVLAALDSGTTLASVTVARGSLAAAQAKLKGVIEGATTEEITLAKVALDNAKRDYDNISISQQSLVDNSYSNLLNSTPEVVPDGGNNDYTAPTISGSYTGTIAGSIKISTYYSGTSTFSTSGLATTTGAISSTSPQPIGTTGLYIKFPSTSPSNISNWVIELPNKKASNYTTNFNAFQQSLKTQTQSVSSAKSIVEERIAQLAIRQAAARGSDIALAQANVLSAEGGLQQAQAQYENTIIRAPSYGTVTKVDIKYGELADIKKASIILQDITNIYVESDINESNITKVILGQNAEIIFDALGSDRKFTGQVVHIDPSSVTTEGVVNYRIKVSINEKDKSIRPGMNSEIVITSAMKKNVIAVPQSAITSKNGKSYVYIITNEKRKTYKEREVSVSGFIGDGNLAEVTTGLSASDKIALLSK